MWTPILGSIFKPTSSRFLVQNITTFSCWKSKQDLVLIILVKHDYLSCQKSNLDLVLKICQYQFSKLNHQYFMSKYD